MDTNFFLIILILAGSFLLDKFLDRFWVTKGWMPLFNPQNNSELIVLIDFLCGIVSPCIYWGSLAFGALSQVVILYPYNPFSYSLVLSTGGFIVALLLLFLPPKFLKSTRDARVFVKSRAYRKIVYTKSVVTILSPPVCCLTIKLMIMIGLVNLSRNQQDPTTGLGMLLLMHIILSWLFVLAQLCRFLKKNKRDFLEQAQ